MKTIFAVGDRVQRKRGNRAVGQVVEVWGAINQHIYVLWPGRKTKQRHYRPADYLRKVTENERAS